MYHLYRIDVPSLSNSPDSRQAKKAAEKREKKLKIFQIFFPICIYMLLYRKAAFFPYGTPLPVQSIEREPEANKRSIMIDLYLPKKFSFYQHENLFVGK